MTLTAKAKNDAGVATTTAAVTIANIAVGKTEQAAHSALAMADAPKAEKEATHSALVTVDASQAEEECAKNASVKEQSKEGCVIITSEKVVDSTKAKAQDGAQARAATSTAYRPNSTAVNVGDETKAKAKTQAESQAEAKYEVAEARAAREAEDLRLDRLEAHCIAVEAELDRLKDEAVDARRRAKQAEHRATVMNTARIREIREVQHHTDSARVICGRVGGQYAAERKERVLRKKRLDQVCGREKARADRAELSLKRIREFLAKEKETVERLTAKKEALETENLLKEARLLADGALRDAAAIGSSANASEPATRAEVRAKISGPPTSAAKISSKEGLWLESPARTGSSAALAVSGDGTGEAGGEEEEKERRGADVAVGPDVVVGSVVTVGVVGAVGGIPLPPATTAREEKVEGRPCSKEDEIRRTFLEGRKLRHGVGRVQEFVPAVSLPVQCSLSPTSKALQRGPLLGSGKFGVVTVVRHALGRFALKEVAPYAINSRVGRNAAKHEMRVLLSLTSHPHVITLKGLDDTIPTMPILLELAVCDAFEILENGHCHSWLQKTSVLRDAALGLKHVQTAGWIHTDFKAENVLIVKGDGRLLQGKIADFGLSRLEGDVRPKMTGSPGYIPMENLTEAVAATKDQDVFSLAVFMLMMFIRPELEGNNVFALEVLLTDEEREELNSMEESDLDASIAFDSKVMQRTSVDGSFEEILEPSSLQDGVPLPEEVCEWLKACLSSDISSRLSMTDLASNLNRLVEHSKPKR